MPSWIKMFYISCCVVHPLILHVCASRLLILFYYYCLFVFKDPLFWPSTAWLYLLSCLSWRTPLLRFLCFCVNIGHMGRMCASLCSGLIKCVSQAEGRRMVSSHAQCSDDGSRIEEGECWSFLRHTNIRTGDCTHTHTLTNTNTHTNTLTHTHTHTHFCSWLCGSAVEDVSPSSHWLS